MNIADLIFELVGEAVQIAKDSAAASAEELAALEAKVQASLAALRDAGAQTHADMDARLSALEAELKALKLSKSGALAEPAFKL